jgi:hypothetical protein
MASILIFLLPYLQCGVGLHVRHKDGPTCRLIERIVVAEGYLSAPPDKDECDGVLLLISSSNMVTAVVAKVSYSGWSSSLFSALK